MALFSRNKTDQDGMPPEVQNYYQAEGRQRSWTAWLMALATLFVTVVVVLGIFFGGRWAFRKLKNGGQPTVTVQTETEKPAETAAPANPTTPAAPSTPKTPSTPQTSSTSTSQPSQASLPESASTQPSAATPGKATGSNLPSTGPGDMVAVFVLTTIIAAIFHNRVLRVRSPNS